MNLIDKLFIETDSKNTKTVLLAPL